MRVFLLSIFALNILFCSCTDSANHNDKLLVKIDSLNNQMKKLEELLNTRDTSAAEVMKSEEKNVDQPTEMAEAITEVKKEDKTTKTEKRLETKVEQIPTEKPIKNRIKQTEDTVKHYYRNSKALSVIITPWQDMRRKLIFYNPFGVITYEIEDANMSYSSITDINAFHPNGAVDKVHISLNPGASMYWYDSVITFDINNNPLWMESTKHPSSLADMMDNRSYWDKSCNCWKKQEIVREQPVPQPGK